MVTKGCWLFYPRRKIHTAITPGFSMLSKYKNGNTNGNDPENPWW